MDQEGSKQALGLMNRQVRLDNQEANEEEENFDFSNFNPDDMLTNKQNQEQVSKANFSVPPDEDFLYNNTLWPENSKLYGHGYDVIAVASSHDGTLIASGGKSQSEKHSKLFLWDAAKKNLIKKLDGHVLTIVQIQFSHNDQFILTVSRDRSLCIFERNTKIEEKENEKDYKLIQLEKETHARIIWGCAWSKDSELFITGSRDNTIKVWKKRSNVSPKEIEDDKEKKFIEAYSHEFSDAVTSVNLLDEKINGMYIAFVGLENGEIFVVKIKNEENSEKVSLEVLNKFPLFISHGMAVKRIKSFVQGDKVKIATCSDDHSVRIFEVATSYFEK